MWFVCDIEGQLLAISSNRGLQSTSARAHFRNISGLIRLLGDSNLLQMNVEKTILRRFPIQFTINVGR